VSYRPAGSHPLQAFVASASASGQTQPPLLSFERMTASPRIPGLRGEFLWELDIVVKQTVGMAEAMPAELYDWRPSLNARSVSEVFVHVATGNFMLLDIIGIRAPEDLYGGLATDGKERFSDMMRRNDELAARAWGKDSVISILKRSLQSVSQSFKEASNDELDRRLYFFGEETTVRRVYLRLLAHANEHMGQMIAYFRFNGIAPPWPDWRPDRRRKT
jgi:uncharacterized damage-inducible protein DinB